MEHGTRGRAVVKFLFWTAVAASLVFMMARAHVSGQLAAWYYHTAAIEGYAVNADTFLDATADAPATLAVGKFERIEGRQAVPVRKGDRLPANANGIIGKDILDKGARATLAGDTIVVKVPWKISESKGFKFKDTFKHKGIKTYPWGAAWNVAMTLGIGLALGFMAEGFTDLLGIKLEKIRHFEGH